MQQRTTRNQSNTRLQESFLVVSAAVVAAFYAVMGIVILVYPVMLRGFTQNARLIIGIALILYASFRGYRAYMRWNPTKR